MIVEYLICLEESYNYQEAHQGEVKSIEAELSLKISGDSYDHLSEGKHDIQHDPFAQMTEVHGYEVMDVLGCKHENYAEQHCDR